MSDQQNAQASFPRRFEGRTVLVTGAGTGFGAEMAVRAAQEGAHVVVHYNRSREGAEQTAKRIEQTGGQAALVQADTRTGIARACCRTSWPGGPPRSTSSTAASSGERARWASPSPSTRPSRP